jgi:hypothetical protein
VDIRVEITSKRPRKIHNVKAYEGRIYIGDFNEHLYIPLDWWTIEDYKRQWKEGLERIKTHDTSCLVVTIHDPGIRKFVDWWTLYKEGNTIYVQNGWLIEDAYEQTVGNKPFTPETCYDFVSPRTTHTEEGDKISEWSVPYNDSRDAQ